MSLDKHPLNSDIASFSVPQFIQEKRDNKEHSEASIKKFIQAYVAGQIPDYQVSAWLMATTIRGMTKKETKSLTDAMLHSGTILHFQDKTVVDKHSTGGVGDKTSFLCAPIAAAAGVKVPMIAGRGLGHTGGTVDKIEAIAGFNTQLDLDSFSQQLIKHGIVLIGQTPQIAPADRKIYALRDVTGTIESIPLITASIMSKKLAEGAAGIVLDIKVGSGAFMKSLSSARKLASSLRETGLRYKQKVSTFITDMNQPLGSQIGHSLEIIECLEILHGKRNPESEDLRSLSLDLAAAMILNAGLTKNYTAAKKVALEKLESGKALEKFKVLIKLQGGDASFVDNPSKFSIAPIKTAVTMRQGGYLKSLEPLSLGLACVEIGGGRKMSSDKIDHSVGITVHKKVGDKVKAGEPILSFIHHDGQTPQIERLITELKKNSIRISKTKVRPLKLIHEIK
jgi:pyrimidine-nucleoside phosphorylase